MIWKQILLKENIMVDIDVIYEKINSVQNCLQRIKTTVGGNVEVLRDLNVQDIVVLNLQRAVQLVIDIASYVIASEKLGIPKTLKDSFQILHQNKIINVQTRDQMERMVGFRNIAVHNYQAIDFNILKSILTKHLPDLEIFCEQIVNYSRTDREEN